MPEGHERSYGVEDGQSGKERAEDRPAGSWKAAGSFSIYQTEEQLARNRTRAAILPEFVTSPPTAAGRSGRRLNERRRETGFLFVISITNMGDFHRSSSPWKLCRSLEQTKEDSSAVLTGAIKSRDKG